MVNANATFSASSAKVTGRREIGTEDSLLLANEDGQSVCLDESSSLPLGVRSSSHVLVTACISMYRGFQGKRYICNEIRVAVNALNLQWFLQLSCEMKEKENPSLRLSTLSVCSTFKKRIGGKYFL